jgi:tight adherence protein B
LLAALGLGFAAGCGGPLWLLKYLKKRREAKFLRRSRTPSTPSCAHQGRPAVLDSLRIITTDAPEPLEERVRAIVETQTIAFPSARGLRQALRAHPPPGGKFFGIVIAIQQKAGGNLSEALGNLSKVLRERKKMKPRSRPCRWRRKPRPASSPACRSR